MHENAHCFAAVCFFNLFATAQRVLKLFEVTCNLLSNDADSLMDTFRGVTTRIHSLDNYSYLHDHFTDEQLVDKNIS